MDAILLSIGQSKPLEDLPSDAVLLGGLAVVLGASSFKRTPVHEHVLVAGYTSFIALSAPLLLDAVRHRVVGTCAKGGDTFVVVELRDFDECHSPVFYCATSHALILTHIAERARSRRYTMSMSPAEQRGLVFIPTALNATAIATRPEKGQVPSDVVQFPRA